MSEVQIRLSEALKPEPAQLHGVAAHTTETRLFGPARVPVTLIPDSDLAVKLDASGVASPPNCSQFTESVAFCAAWLFTRTRLSGHARLETLRNTNNMMRQLQRV